MPLHQHSLSLAVDEASHQRLLSPLVPVPWPSPLLCPMLATGSMAFHRLLWVSISRIGSFDAVFSIVLVGSSSPQFPLLLSRMSLHCRHLWRPQSWMWRDGDRIMQHNAIRDVIFCAAQSAALAPSIEFPNLIFSRPADIYLPTWSRGHPAALDVHVISPLQQQTLGEAAFSPGYALVCLSSFTGASNPGNDCASVFSVAYSKHLLHKISD